MSLSDRESSIRTRNKLRTASTICAIFVGIEFVGGYVSGSLAVVSDAAHLATDLLAFLIAMMASHFASLNETKTFNYGYKRLESLAALFSVSSLVVVTLWLLYQSLVRFVVTVLIFHRDSIFGGGDSYGSASSEALYLTGNNIFHHDSIFGGGDSYGSASSEALYLTGYNTCSNGTGTTSIPYNEDFEVVINGAVMSGTAALGVL